MVAYNQDLCIYNYWYNSQKLEIPLHQRWPKLAKLKKESGQQWEIVPFSCQISQSTLLPVIRANIYD